MTDCPNAEIRDLLPDYVHDQLSSADYARVAQHLVSCAECADELALLQAVFEIRPSVSSVNIIGILASLPKPGQHASVTVFGDVPAAAIEGVREIGSARSAATKRGGFRTWRIAAAIAAVTVGGLSVAIARQGFVTVNEQALPDSASVIGMASVPAYQLPVSSADAALRQSDSRNALSIGDLSEFSDEQLDAMNARLEQWDGSASVEPLPGVPILPPGS